MASCVSELYSICCSGPGDCIHKWDDRSSVVTVCVEIGEDRHGSVLGIRGGYHLPAGHTVDQCHPQSSTPLHPLSALSTPNRCPSLPPCGVRSRTWSGPEPVGGGRRGGVNTELRISDNARRRHCRRLQCLCWQRVPGRLAMSFFSGIATQFETADWDSSELD